MTIKQLSIFMENKYGTLVKVLQILKKKETQIIASTIADTADYGICRIICDKPDVAYEALKEEGIAVSLCDVFAIQLEDKPGSASDVIGSFASAGININYLYSFLFKGNGVLIFKTDNVEGAKKIIDQKDYSSFKSIM